MEIDKCKDCYYCTTASEENENGEYITLYCCKPTQECPFEKVDNN